MLFLVFLYFYDLWNVNKLIAASNKTEVGKSRLKSRNDEVGIIKRRGECIKDQY